MILVDVKATKACPSNGSIDMHVCVCVREREVFRFRMQKILNPIGKRNNCITIHMHVRAHKQIMEVPNIKYTFPIFWSCRYDHASQASTIKFFLDLDYEKEYPLIEIGLLSSKFSRPWLLDG